MRAVVQALQGEQAVLGRAVGDECSGKVVCGMEGGGVYSNGAGCCRLCTYIWGFAFVPPDPSLADARGRFAEGKSLSSTLPSSGPPEHLAVRMRPVILPSVCPHVPEQW